MGSKPEIMLFVKAGDDGKKYGACPFCQRVFMILLVKSKAGAFHFKVATVNLAKPPDIFKKLTLRRVPALVVDDTALDNVDEIVQFLEDTYPTPSLQYGNVIADEECRNVFQKFCFYIKEVSKDNTQLEAELYRIDSYLEQSGFKFLCCDNITHLDCELLPKLHHVRVASKYLKGYDFPHCLKHLWRYLENAYKEDVFVKACPSDQEIIVHWADKPETPKLSMEERARMAREEPKFSFAIPAAT